MKAGKSCPNVSLYTNQNKVFAPHCNVKYGLRLMISNENEHSDSWLKATVSLIRPGW